MKFSIRLRLIIFTLFVVVLVGGLISLYSIFQVRQQILSTFEQQAREITRMISRNVTNGLYYLDVNLLRVRLQHFRQNPDFSYTYVMDRDGIILADGTKDNPFRDERFVDPFTSRVLRSDDLVSEIKEDVLKIGGPVAVADGTRIGYIQIGFTLDRINGILNNTTITDFYITIACLGIGIVLAIILSTNFTKPILSIVKASRKIGEGNLDTQLSIKRSDELGILADSINRMGLSLKSQLKHINTLHDFNVDISSTLDFRRISALLLEKVDDQIPVPTLVALRLFNLHTRQLDTVALRRDGETMWRAEVPEEKYGFSPSFGNSPVLTVPNALYDARTPHPELLREHGLISFLGVPLIAKSEVLGDLSIYTTVKHGFTAGEIDFFHTLAGQAAIAIQNSQLYEQSRQQTAELEKANKAKDEFLAIMSHELRTPLNVVLGYTEMAHGGLFGQLTPELEKALGKVVGQSRDLLTMINSILQATSLQVREVKAESRDVNLHKFLADLKSNFEVGLVEEELALFWDLPDELPMIRTDPDKLEHVLQNIIRNAIKFTEKGSITISARYLPELATAEFKVTDTGIGIQKEVLPSIFDIFSQGDTSSTRQYGGAGVGLYIVKKFTDLLGGKIEVESKPGKGSIFTLKIPNQSYSAAS